jgi:hypothetical protein
MQHNKAGHDHIWKKKTYDMINHDKIEITTVNTRETMLKNEYKGEHKINDPSCT